MPDLVEDHDQQHRKTLKIEGKAKPIKSTKKKQHNSLYQ